MVTSLVRTKRRTSAPEDRIVAEVLNASSEASWCMEFGIPVDVTAPDAEVVRQVFEKYLPYAIAFGVEKIWGDRFQDKISKALVDPNYRSSWYGGSIMNYGSFSSHMNSSFSSSMQSSSTAPSSSGGSGGGGSSGGGGGGGGGGGW